MAFLDELKKEAEAQKLQEQTQTQSKLAAVSQNFLHVQIRYKEIHHYLRELVNQLNVLTQDIKRTYMIEGFGQIDDFRPCDYALNIDSIRIGQKDFANTIVFRFKCRTEKEISIERYVPIQIDSLKEHFWQSNLKYQCTEFKNDRGLVARAHRAGYKDARVVERGSASSRSFSVRLGTYPDRPTAREAQSRAAKELGLSARVTGDH